MVRGNRGAHRGLFCLLAAALCAAALIAGTAEGSSVQVGDLRVTFKGSLSPDQLPRTKQVPVSLSLAGQIKTLDGSHVPPVKSVTLALNRHGVFDTAGIPTCAPARLKGTNTDEARNACRRALIGSGGVKGEVSLPQQPPFRAYGALLIFNGGMRKGVQLLVTQVFAYVPAPTTFVTTIPVRTSSAELGTRMEVKVPSIAVGQGSLTEFHATIWRGVRANCPAPNPLPRAVYPFGKASLRFPSGLDASTTVLRQCRVGP